MGTGWRRAFCTSVRRDPETSSASASTTILEQQSPSSSRSFVKLGIGIFSGSGGGGGSNPSSNQSTPRLRSTTSTPRCRTATPPPPPQQQTLSESPRLQCKTTTAPASDATSTSTTPKTSSSSSIIGNPKEISPRLFRSSSPRSPSRFALFKTALRLSRNRCGICGEGVRSSVGAVFTAECSHAFHFPCISSHVRAQGCLVCPVCSITWSDAPLLASSLQPPSPSPSPPPAAPPPNASVSARRHRSRHSTNSTRRDGERASLAPAVAAGGGGGGRINPKIYDDDESLQLSPTGRVADGLLQFNPIPEELEAEDGDTDDGDDDDVECQHKENFKQEGELQRADGTKSALSVIPDSLALVSTSRNHLTYVVSIKVKAPHLSPRPQSIAAAAAAAPTLPVIIPQSLLDHPSCRAPIDLVTVLDVSGNMTATKLQMLKRAMRLVISSLGPGDRLSIVAFSVAAAKRLFPLRRMSRTGQRSARQIVDRLVICGTTQAQAQGDCSSASCMGDALRKATKVLEDRRERNPIATIMLLSDVQRQGHDQQKQQNVYATTPRSNSGSYRSQNNQTSSATRFAHIEIPIHASASFQDLQKQQQQQQRKRANPPNSGMLPVMEEDNAFAKCMNGLVSMVLQDVHLQFTLPSASGVISSVYSYSYGGAGECDGSIGQAFSHGEGGKSVSLGDLYVDEVRQLLVELKVPKAALLEGHAMSNISVMCSYRDPLTRDVIRKPHIMPIPMPLQPQDQNQRQSNSQFPVLLRSFSSSSSTTTAQSNQDDQQQLRNLFVTTRAVAESRRLVELSDLDTAIHLLSSAQSLLLQHSTTAVISNTQKKLVLRLEAELQDLQRVQQEQHQQQRRWRQQQQPHSLSPSHRRWSEQALLGEARGGGGGGEPLTPTSAWRAAEQLAKVAIMRKSLNRVSDLHGLENARF